MEKTWERLVIHAPRRAEIDERKMKKHIGSVLDSSRAMEEAEFEIQKEKLAENLISPFKLHDLAMDLNRKIEVFLVSPEIIPLLEERLQKGRFQ